MNRINQRKKKLVMFSVLQSVIALETDSEQILLTQNIVQNVGSTVDLLMAHHKELKNRTSFEKKKNRFIIYYGINGLFNDTTFADHFRMSRKTFEIVLQTLASSEQEIRKFYIPHNAQLMMFLWILATPDSFRSVAKRFKMNKGSVHFVYVRLIKKFTSLASNFIKWPTQQKLQKIKEEVKNKSDFPGVCGFIDGTFIHIPQPKDPVKYYNRKKFPALILQAVCDNNMTFTDIYFGEVGSLNDKRVFSRSPLAEKITRNANELFGEDGHLLGDGGYTLSDRLLIPYIDNGHLVDEQVHFNYVLSSIRSTIERAFALLKGKWRRLKYLDSQEFNYIRDHVIACCVLHNFILREKDEFAKSFADEPDQLASSDVGNDSLGFLVERNTKRDNIAAYLYEKHYCE